MLFGPAKSMYLLNTIVASLQLKITVFTASKKQDKKCISGNGFINFIYPFSAAAVPAFKVASFGRVDPGQGANLSQSCIDKQPFALTLTPRDSLKSPNQLNDFFFLFFLLDRSGRGVQNPHI